MKSARMIAQVFCLAGLVLAAGQAALRADDPTTPGTPTKFCCEGQNLVKNGDFEEGNSGFGSSYGYNASTAVGATKAGMYNVVNGVQAYDICSNWKVEDRFTCGNPKTGQFMVLNGRTGGTTANPAIWTSAPIGTPFDGFKPKEYVFCFRAKHLPACCFDTPPVLSVKATGNIGYSQNAGPFPVNAGSGACDWQLITVSLTVPASTNTITLNITLNEPGPPAECGNDLALDDIGLFKIDKLAPSSATFDLDDYDQTDTGFKLKATFTGKLPPNQNCTYQWTVYQVDSAGVKILNSEVTAIPADWKSPNLTTQFNGYNGINTTLNGPSPGTFLNTTRYRVKLTVSCDCGAKISFSKPADFLPDTRKVRIGPLKAVEDVETGARPDPRVKPDLDSRPLPKGPGITPVAPVDVNPRRPMLEPKVVVTPGRPEVKPMPKGDPMPPKGRLDPRKDRTPLKDGDDPKKDKGR